jgi:hypothetical protein
LTFGSESGGRTPRPSVLAAVVATLGAIVFAPAISGGFIYDDRALVADNVHVHSFGEWPRWITHDFWDVNEEVNQLGSRMSYWRPGVSASYAMDWLIGAGSPVPFHATNLAWHAAASLLAFFALRRWLGAAIPAFFAALLFAVHPTKAESVAWIAGRTDVMCAVAMLVACEGMARRLAGLRGGALLEVAGTALAYTMKEQAVVLFAFAAVETWVALGRPALDGPALRRIARGAAPQVAIAAAYVVARAIFMPVRPPHDASLGPSSHAAEVLETMGRFAALTFAPHDLSVQQGLIRAPGGRMAFETGYVTLGVLFVITLAGVAVATRKRSPGVAMGIAFFAVTLLPTSNVVTTDLVALLSERFLYVPLLGLALAVTAAALEARGGERRAGVLVAGACAAVLALGVLSARRAADFQDEERFWARELGLHPDSLEALRFHIQLEAKEKRFAKALEYVARAQRAAASEYPQTGFELDFIVQGVELSVATIPDHDARALHAADEFLAAILDGRRNVATLATKSLAVELPIGGPTLARRIDRERPRMLALRAGIASRSVDDRSALELAAAAQSLCPGCFDVGRTAAIVAARAGQYESAARILDGVARFTGEPVVASTRAIVRSAERTAREADAAQEPSARLQLRAMALCTLEAWGRAFDVLAPARADIERVPPFALAFAELAWRAGEFAAAREVLASLMPARAAEETTRGWSLKMGWIDAPRAEKAEPIPL